MSIAIYRKTGAHVAYKVMAFSKNVLLSWDVSVTS